MQRAQLGLDQGEGVNGMGHGAHRVAADGSIAPTRIRAAPGGVVSLRCEIPRTELSGAATLTMCQDW